MGTDGRVDPRRTAAVLAELDADFVGLQEVDWRHDPIEELDHLAYLEREIGMCAFAGPNLTDHRGRFGNGLLARIAPAQCAHVDLSVRRYEARGVIDGVFGLDHGSLRVIVTHLGLSPWERGKQYDALRRLLRDGPPADATVLLGDLNEWRWNRIVRQLVPDPFTTMTRLRTFPSRYPLLPLDVILVRPEPARFEASVLSTPASRLASDHLPVVADIDWS